MLTQIKINEIVRRHRPKGWRVQQSKHRSKVCSAQAHWEKKTLYVPTLDNANALFLFLHEAGHVRQDHFHHSLPYHREEYEAERYALHVFRTEGIGLPRQVLDDARERIRIVIDKDIQKGVKIQRHVARWAKHGG